MMFSEIIDRYVEQSGVTVMFRGTLENVVTPELLDEIFAKTAKRQRSSKKLLFSSVVDLMALVATGMRKSVNDAYKAKEDQFTVSVTSVYNKLDGVETEVSRQLVRQTAARMAEVVERLGPRRQPLLRGYRTRIADGNHLAATEHRIHELRFLSAGPLPGHAIVILDPDQMLVSDVFPCEDGHAQERSLLPQVLLTVEPGDLWIADRNFCTIEFLFGIARRPATFIIRQHKNLPYELLGTRRRIGRCPTGMMFEQQMRLADKNGKTMDVRRITIELDKPTRDGETEIHLVTNLPSEDADARKVAALYLDRWTIENAFQELDQAFNGEIKTLGYPGAALLSFCVALLAYNVTSVVKSALAAVHGEKAKRRDLSGYYLAGEIAATYHGMEIVVPETEWAKHFGSLAPAELANTLKAIAVKVRPDRFLKTGRGEKKPMPKRSSDKRHPHVSTARILSERM